MKKVLKDIGKKFTVTFQLYSQVMGGSGSGELCISLREAKVIVANQAYAVVLGSLGLSQLGQPPMQRITFKGSCL